MKKENDAVIFVLEEIDEFRAFVNLKSNGCRYAYLEWFTGDVNRPNQWMLAELSWFTATNELKHKVITKKVVSSFDMLKLAEFISDESVKKSERIKREIGEKARSLVEKATKKNGKE